MVSGNFSNALQTNRVHYKHVDKFDTNAMILSNKLDSISSCTSNWNRQDFIALLLTFRS